MSQGRFVWYDLMTTDPAAAERFYGALFGWTFEPHGPEYRMMSADGRGMGGIVAMKASDAVPNHWVAYITVADVNATCAKVQELGGKVIVPTHPIPGTGEFATFTDRHGASFSAIRLDNDTPEPPRAKGSTAISWAELHSPDPADSLAFYGEIFGWKSESWDMGGGQLYYLVGDEHSAGIMAAMPGAPPHWLLYANVANADAAVAKAQDLGARLVHGPADIPNVGRFAIFIDPLGAVFAVMQNAADPGAR